MIQPFFLDKLYELACCPLGLFDAQGHLLVSKQLESERKAQQQDRMEKVRQFLQRLKSSSLPLLFQERSELAGICFPDQTMLVVGPLPQDEFRPMRLKSVNVMLECFAQYALDTFTQNLPFTEQDTEDLLADLGTMDLPLLEDVLPHRDMHNAYSYELGQAEAVTAGDPELFLRNDAKSRHGTPADLAFTPLRNKQNHCIVNAVLLSRAAIRGGLPPEVAYTAADFFILSSEKQTTEQACERLRVQMGVVFARLVRKQRESHANTARFALTRKICEYVRRHIFEDFSRQQMAEELHKNADYLDRCFKADMQQTITSFLKQERIKVACDLLTGTTMEIYAIAEMLQFSSASQFVRAFRRMKGVTPLVFRKEGYRQPFADS